MAVVGTAKIRQGYPRGDFSLSGRKYTVQWLVTVDSYDDGAIVAQSASGLPAADDTYSIGNDSDSLARLREWSAHRLEDNSLTWVVEATYSTPPEKQGGTGGGGPHGAGAGTHRDSAGAYADPTIEIPVVKTFSVEREVPVTRIFNVNTGRYNAPHASNCEIFNPPATRKDRYLGLSISRNEVLSTYHPGIGVSYSGAVNSDWWWGLSPGTWQCQSITAERQTKQIQGGGTYAFLRCEYTFHARPEGWDLMILNAGNFYLTCLPDGSGSGSGSSSGSGSGSGCCRPGDRLKEDGRMCEGAADGVFYYADCPSGSGSGSGYSNNNCRTQCTRKIAFTDKQGHPIKGLLNWNGGKLADGADPTYMRLRVYNWLPFGPLALPQSFASVM